MIQVIVFVPSDFKEHVKLAMFNAGAGALGNYDSCCFEQEGVGQFRPLKDSRAFIGTIGQVEKVSEHRIEMCVQRELLVEVIKAMKEAHPYETPAYYAIDLLKI